MPNLTDQAPPPAFEDRLRAGGFVVTAEITPPVSASRDDLIAKALPLKGLADAVNVTDAAGARAHMSSLAAAAILIENGIEPIVQFTCRDRNRIALQGDLLGAAALGAHMRVCAARSKAGDQADASRCSIGIAQLMETRPHPRQRRAAVGARSRQGLFSRRRRAPLTPSRWKTTSPKEIEARRAVRQTIRRTGNVPLHAPPRRGARRQAYFLIASRTCARESASWMREHLLGTIIPTRSCAHGKATAPTPGPQDAGE